VIHKLSNNERVQKARNEKNKELKITGDAPNAAGTKGFAQISLLAFCVPSFPPPLPPFLWYRATP